MQQRTAPPDAIHALQLHDVHRAGRQVVHESGEERFLRVLGVQLRQLRLKTFGKQ